MVVLKAMATVVVAREEVMTITTIATSPPAKAINNKATPATRRRSTTQFA